MIDNLSLGLSHGLMLLAAWLLLRRPDLDDESGKAKTRFFKRRGGDIRGGDVNDGNRPGA